MLNYCAPVLVLPGPHKFLQIRLTPRFLSKGKIMVLSNPHIPQNIHKQNTDTFWTLEIPLKPTEKRPYRNILSGTGG
jgi:hypothetical protein